MEWPRLRFSPRSGVSFIPPPGKFRRDLPPQKGPRILTERDARLGSCRLIDEQGRLMGVVELREALALAQERELDLVEIAATASPRTCKLMDFGKFRYQQTKKTKGQKKTADRRKEVKLRPKTEDHDFKVKVERARRFLEKGHKVLVTMMFRGREMVHIDRGRDLLLKFAEALADCAKLEKEPSREGRNRVDMILIGKHAPPARPVAPREADEADELV